MTEQLPSAPATPAKREAPRWRRRLLRSPLAIAGFIFIGLFVFAAAFAPFIAPYSPVEQNLRGTYVPPMRVEFSGPQGQPGLWVRETARTPMGEILRGDQLYPLRFFVRGEPWVWWGGLLRSDLHLFGVDGPVKFYLLGADEQGRDILSRLTYGAWISLSIGLIAVAIGMLIGVPVGLISGYYGGTFDLIVQRIVEIMLSFPGILLAIVLVATLGTGLTNVMIAVGIAAIPIYARLVRGSVLSLRDREYVEASRALGNRDNRIMLGHILPNALSPIIVQSSLQMAVAILFAAGLGFLGLGARPPEPEWGLMLARGREYLATAPHVATFPGLAIMFVALGFNLLGDALRDALDPRTTR
ncbi:MAG: ABC transporter permease [Meiothermus sp.]|nr:ABC transporter permease [Meiothermus sp.]